MKEGERRECKLLGRELRRLFPLCACLSLSLLVDVLKVPEGRALVLEGEEMGKYRNRWLWTLEYVE